MRLNMKSAKRTKLWTTLVVLGLIFFVVGMAGVVIDACTVQNVTLAWVLFGVIIVGSTTLMCGLVLFLVYNKELINEYIKKFK